MMAISWADFKEKSLKMEIRQYNSHLTHPVSPCATISKIQEQIGRSSRVLLFDFNLSKLMNFVYRPDREFMIRK